uniref:Uncharacterized protein n=1 Tax=Triticum urartu TaxID=4572 RepID=A0A8R7PTI1_TRIUA
MVVFMFDLVCSTLRNTIRERALHFFIYNWPVAIRFAIVLN